MKRLLKILAMGILSLATAVAAEEEDEEIKEIKNLTRSFWSQMISGKSAEAKKSVYVKEDDIELASADVMAKRVAEEFGKMVTLLKDPEVAVERSKDPKEITVGKIQEQGGRKVASVEMLIWEPREKEFEEVSFTWVKTLKSGWKIVDL